MWTWSTVDDRGRTAGFTLFEALVALIVAGLLLPALARSLAQAWTATRAPMETVSAMALAREAAFAADLPQARGFRIARSMSGIEIRVLESDIAPAPAGSAHNPNGDDQKPTAVPDSMKLAIASSFGTRGPDSPAAPSPRTLVRISVVVDTPSGRSVAFDTVRLDAAP